MSAIDNSGFGYLVAVCLALCQSGCADQSTVKSGRGKVSDHTVWRASNAYGDKVGNGIELVQQASRISGTFYILNPGKPHDFSAGKPIPMELVRHTGSEIVFKVDYGRGQVEEILIQYEGRLEGWKVKATIQNAAGGDRAIPFTFTRQEGKRNYRP